MQFLLVRRISPFKKKTSGKRTLRMIVAVACSTIYVTISHAQTTNAENERVHRITLHAKEPPTFKQFSVLDNESETVAGTTMPSIYERRINTTAGPVKLPLTVVTSWDDDKRHKLAINLWSFSPRTSLNVYFFKFGIAPDTALSVARTKCQSTSSADPETLMSRLFACKDLVDWLDTHSEAGTKRYHTALRGWFYAAWHLFNLGNNGIYFYEMDTEIVERMDKLLLENQSELLTVSGKIDVADVRNKLREYRVADILLNREVNRLRDAGNIREAKLLIDFIISRFPSLKEAAGGTPFVLGVNIELLRRSEAELQTKARERGIVLPPPPE